MHKVAISNNILIERSITVNKDVHNLKISMISLVIKNNLTFAITYYFHFRKTTIMTYLLSLQ